MAALAIPSPASRADPRPAPATRTAARPAPLASSPGPLPAPPRLAPAPGPVPRAATRAAERARAAEQPPSGWTAAGLAAAGAVVLLLGALGGWSATRALGGQSAFTTLNVTTASAATTPYQDALGFTVPVPNGWVQSRTTPAGGEPSVSFVSPDGTEALTVARAASTEAAQAVGDGSTIRLLQPAAAVSGGPSGVVELSYGTDTRTSWRRIVPAGGAVWTITLTVPAAAAGSLSAGLFEELARGFATVAT